ncbi:hypothetical protein ACFV3R_25090 [Streptomyces sp. NPDC059740]|uniref:hypothetical protein n=1 Tax=Streptomyces sp. NPDC059740 TaxID=3346926 RepID=UPI00365AB323
MRRTVTTVTVNHFTGTSRGGFTFAEVTLLLVRMTAAQVTAWQWIGDMRNGTEPLEGWEIRDTTGALLGAMLPLGHRAHRLHVEVYNPTTADFYYAGQTTDAIHTQGVSAVLAAYTATVAPVPDGKDFTLEEPRLVLERSDCFAGVCPEDCPACAADDLECTGPFSAAA